MKFTIDTTTKTISIEGNVPLTELFKTLNKYFPKGAWKEYELIVPIKSHTPITYPSPIYPYPGQPYVNVPYVAEPYYYGTSDFSITTSN